MVEKSTEVHEEAQNLKHMPFLGSDKCNLIKRLFSELCVLSNIWQNGKCTMFVYI